MAGALVGCVLVSIQRIYQIAWLVVLYPMFAFSHPLTGGPGSDPLTETNSNDTVVKFLEARLQRDPDNFLVRNKLAGYYLQRQRVWGSLEYLELARKAALISLNTVAAANNVGGLAALAQAEYALHNFHDSSNYAKQLIDLDPGKSYPYLLLADSLIELGQYQDVKSVLAQAEQRILARGASMFELNLRYAQLATLKGETKAAGQYYQDALNEALDFPETTYNRENRAWCRWKLGEFRFSIGNYDSAEKLFQKALADDPQYYRALASMGRIAAARSNYPKARNYYRRAIALAPDPIFIAALGDLYLLTGENQKAARQYQRVQTVPQKFGKNQELYNRQLALFYADHKLKTEEAYQNAKREYQSRKDIYGADALAWAALKAGHLGEAQVAIKQALRLGTQDAKLFYHAGMIALARNEKQIAHKYLTSALALSPKFDPYQAKLAEEALLTIANSNSGTTVSGR